jgi:acyl carrier protein
MSRPRAMPEVPGLIGLIAETLDIPGGELADDTGPGRHPGWTSLKHVQLIVAIEETYGIELSSQEIRGMASVVSIEKTLSARGVLDS